MQIVISFAPWIVYGILDGTSGWAVALVAGLVTSLVTLVLQLRRHEPADVLSLGGLAFFALMLAASPLLSGTGAEAWTQTISHGWIAAIMWLSIAVRRPFTLAFSRSEAPADIVDTPVFLRFNDIITAMWAISFTVGTAVLVALGSGATSTATTVVVAASIVVPVVVMRRYIAHVTASDDTTPADQPQGAQVAA